VHRSRGGWHVAAASERACTARRHRATDCSISRPAAG
jgi:hypothetical protein